MLKSIVYLKSDLLFVLGISAIFFLFYYDSEERLSASLQMTKARELTTLQRLQREVEAELRGTLDNRSAMEARLFQSETEAGDTLSDRLQQAGVGLLGPMQEWIVTLHADQEWPRVQDGAVLMEAIGKQRQFQLEDLNAGLLTMVMLELNGEGAEESLSGHWYLVKLLPLAVYQKPVVEQRKKLFRIGGMLFFGTLLIYFSLIRMRLRQFRLVRESRVEEA